MLAEILFKSLEKQAKSAVTFEARRCLRSRMGNHSCERCSVLCPSQALTSVNGKIVFAEERCSDCLSCVSVCPGDAFSCQFDLLSLLAVPAAGAGSAPAVLGCPKSPLHDNLTRMPCLGLLSEPVLAALHCVAKQEILLDVRSCAGCKNGTVVEHLASRLQEIARKVGTTAGLRLRLTTEDDFKGAEGDNSRRFFLRMTKNSLLGFSRQTAALLHSADAAPTGRTIGEKEPPAPNLFLQQASGLLPQEAGPEKRLLQSYYFEVTASEKCDLCPACTGMCPSGALKRRLNDEGKRLEFISYRCSGCGLCINFCKKQALTLTLGTRNDPELALTIAQGE